MLPKRRGRMQKYGRAAFSLEHYKSVVFDSAFPKGIHQKRINQSQRSHEKLEQVQHVDTLVEQNSSTRHFIVVSPALPVIGSAGLTVGALHIENVAKTAL